MVSDDWISLDQYYSCLQFVDDVSLLYTYLLSDTEVSCFFIEGCFREINEDLAGDSAQDSCGQQEEKHCEKLPW